jgi:hypothetical protein
MVPESVKISRRTVLGVLYTLASRERLKVKMDECGDPIIHGRHGEIGEHGDGRLNARFHGAGPQPFSRAPPSRIRCALALGAGSLVSGGDGADEAQFVFDANSSAGECFLRALGIPRRRTVSPETAERLRRFARMRKTHRREAASGS